MLYASDIGADNPIPQGAFYQGDIIKIGFAEGAYIIGDRQLNFDASRVVPTGPEVVPQHYRQPVALYLGRAAKV